MNIEKLKKSTFDKTYYSPLTVLPDLREIRNEDLELMTEEYKEYIP